MAGIVNLRQARKARARSDKAAAAAVNRAAFGQSKTDRAAAAAARTRLARLLDGAKREE